MRWQGRRQSQNVEDRRSARAPVAAGGGLVVVGIALVAWFLGFNPVAVLNLLQNAPVQQQAPVPAQDDAAREFVAVVLADTEEVWQQQFRRLGKAYQPTKLVLFRDAVPSACGFQSSAVGPFYCPLDQKVYIDLAFFDDLSRRLNAPGDFARAYVIAHEVGHHVQNLLGISDRVHTMQQRSNKTESNELSVRLELQADFLAGVWAHHAERNWRILEEGDIEEAIIAAEAIGDDRLQRRAQGYVVPESFTHGTSKQRTRWFLQGLKTGDIDQGDTFAIGYEQL